MIRPLGTGNGITDTAGSGLTVTVPPPESGGFRMVMDQNSRTGGSMPVSGETANSAAVPPGEESRFGLADLIDIVNPLQHIPVVGLLYRHITGDEIGAVAQILGGGLFGGIVGAAAGGAEALFSSVASTETLDGTTLAVADLKGHYNE